MVAGKRFFRFWLLTAVLCLKKQNPYLMVEKTGERLEVPTTEKVGQLRQTADPEDGREYWMAFGNRNHMVQPGDRAEVVSREP